MQNLLPEDGIAELFADWIEPAAATVLLQVLLEAAPWAQETLHLYGRPVQVPRLVAWCGDPGVAYRYSGMDHVATGWPPGLADLRNRLAQEQGFTPNSVLCNLYRHGGDSMGWHSDAEASLGRNPIIASVSLGAERRFELRHRRSVQTVRVTLPHGSLLMMHGETQHHWRHCLPKVTRPTGARVNLTFRAVRAGVATRNCVK